VRYSTIYYFPGKLRLNFLSNEPDWSKRSVRNWSVYLLVWKSWFRVSWFMIQDGELPAPRRVAIRLHAHLKDVCK
jgi:hypothetical protein